MRVTWSLLVALLVVCVGGPLAAAQSCVCRDCRCFEDRVRGQDLMLEYTFQEGQYNAGALNVVNQATSLKQSTGSSTYG